MKNSAISHPGSQTPQASALPGEPDEQPPYPTAMIGRSVSIDHAARRLGVCRRTVYNRIRAGRLRTIRIAGSQRVLASSLQEQGLVPAATAAARATTRPVR